MMHKEFWLNLTYAVVSITVNNDGIIIAAASILSWTIDKSFDSVLSYLKSEHKLVEIKEIIIS